jgi:hypothetical protein
MFLFTSCNITYKVRNQFYDIEHRISFPCGDVYIELVGRGNSIFTLRQKFDVQSEIYVNTDSLKISYNYKPVIVDYNLKDIKNGSGSIKIDNRKTLDFSFKSDKSVFEGDTILVYNNNYIQCNDDMIALDSLIFSFINNIRIAGVNDP